MAATMLGPFPSLFAVHLFIVYFSIGQRLTIIYCVLRVGIKREIPSHTISHCWEQWLCELSVLDAAHKDVDGALAMAILFLRSFDRFRCQQQYIYFPRLAQGGFRPRTDWQTQKITVFRFYAARVCAQCSVFGVHKRKFCLILVICCVEFVFIYILSALSARDSMSMVYGLRSWWWQWTENRNILLLDCVCCV